MSGRCKALAIVDEASEKKPCRPKTVVVETKPVLGVNGKANVL